MKSRKNKLWIALLGIGLICAFMINIDDAQFNKYNTNHIEVMSSGYTLIDKVYTFMSPDDSLEFDNLLLLEKSSYSIYVEIVTPNNCTLAITVWDSYNRTYNLFYSEICYGQGFTILFGAALEGLYHIKFETYSQANLNMHIKIQYEGLCLYDKIPQDEIDEIIFHQVTSFSQTKTSIEQFVYFNLNCSYKFYIGRVTSIIDQENNPIYLNFSLYDPLTTEFEIYRNHSLAPTETIDTFSFTPAMEGIYSLNLHIIYKNNYVNIGYVITENNNTQLYPSNSTGTEKGYLYVTLEFIIGSLTFSIIIMAIPIILTMRKKKSQYNSL